MASINYVPFQTIIPSLWLNDVDQSVYEGVSLWGVASGADTLVVTLSPVPEDYFNGMLIGVRVAAANTTTTPTINCNGLGLKNIKREGNRALLVGDFPRAGYEALLRFSTTTDCFELLNPGHEEYIPSGTDAVPSSVNAELDRHIISSLRFMTEVQRNDVIGFSGSLDVQSPLQKVIDYVAGKGGGTIQFVPGKYLQGSTLTVSANGVVLLGSGRNTELLRTGDFGDSVKFTGNDATGVVIQDCGMSGFRLNAQGTMTSGALLHLNGCYFSYFDNIWNQNGFHGFWCQATAQLTFKRLYHFNASVFGGTKVGRRLFLANNSSGAYALPHSGGLILSDFNLTGVGSAELVDVCMELDGMDGMWVKNGHFGSSSVANMILNATTRATGFIKVSNVMSDGSWGHGLVFKGDQDSYGCEFSNWLSVGGPNGKKGIHVESTAHFWNVAFANTSLLSYDEHSMLVESPNFTATFANPVMAGASGAGAGNFPAVEFSALAGNTTFSGGRIGGNLTGTGAGFQSHALKLNATSTRVICDGVRLDRNQTGSIDGTGDNTCLVNGCILQESLTVASASTITIPLGRDFAFLSGNNNIDNITIRSVESGPLILARGSDTPVLRDGIGNLILNGNFTMDAGDTITLYCDGASWREISRSAN